MPDVRDSFRNVAANYAKSTFHASTIRLQEVLDLARPKPGDLALDVAEGVRLVELAHRAMQIARHGYLGNPLANRMTLPLLDLEKGWLLRQLARELSV